MLPVLLDLKFVKIYTFGVFLMLSFFWSAFLLWRNIRLSSHKEEEIFDGVFMAIAGGIFFARLVYVILHFDKFGFNIARFILINGYPGASLYGAVIGGVIIFYIYCVVHKISFMDMR
jgi:prolipoprotein diacylglyceryltransferase